MTYTTGASGTANILGNGYKPRGFTWQLNECNILGFIIHAFFFWEFNCFNEQPLGGGFIHSFIIFMHILRKCLASLPLHEGSLQEDTRKIHNGKPAKY